MLPVALISFVLAATQFCAAKTFSRRAWTDSDILKYAENIIITTDVLPGLFLEIDVGENEVLVLADLSSGDLFIGGQLNGADKWNVTTAEALQNYPFFADPISPIGNILQTTVSIGGKSAEQTFIFDSQNPFKDIVKAFPQSPAVGVLGFGPTGESSIHSVLNTSHSPIDQLLLTNATNPYVTFFFLGSDIATNSSGAVPAGFFSVGEHVDLQALLPTVSGLAPPDLSGIHAQPAVPLGVANTFPLSQMLLSGKDIPLAGAASGGAGAVAVLATTSAHSLVPAGVAQAIYGGVAGAAFDSASGLWRVPCGTRLTVEVVVANSTVVMQDESVVLRVPGDAQQCVGAFKVATTPSSDWDVAFGTTFLENVYVLLGYASTSADDFQQPIMRILPYADIQGAAAYDAALGASLGAASSGSASASVAAAHTRFTTVTVTHTPTTTVMIGGPTPAISSGTASSTPSASASASVTDRPDRVAAALDVVSSSTETGTPNGPSGSVMDQLKHCLPALIVLAIVAGLLLIGTIIYCLLRRRGKSPARDSAYTSIHFAESGAQSRALYGHDEDTTKYADPYRDQL